MVKINLPIVKVNLPRMVHMINLPNLVKVNLPIVKVNLLIVKVNLPMVKVNLPSGKS